MDPLSLGKLATDLGILAGLVLWFTWQTSVREERMIKRLDTLETYIRDTMTRALDANTEVMSRLEDWLQRREDGASQRGIHHEDTEDTRVAQREGNRAKD